MKLLLILASAAILSAAEPTPAARQAVEQASKAWTAAVLKGDRPALEKLLAPDLSYTHSSAKTQTREEFLQDATGGGTTYQSIDFENARFRQFGTTVILTHNATIKTVQTGESRLFITEVWAQQNGGWQMVSRQATKLP